MAYGGYFPSNYQNFQPTYQGYQSGQMIQQSTPTPQPMQPMQGLAGRMVTSKEEALGVPADFNGTPLFLPDLSHGVIWVKKFDPNTGSSGPYEFRLVPANEQPIQLAQQAPAYALADDLEKLKAQVEKITNEIMTKANSTSDGGTV